MRLRRIDGANIGGAIELHPQLTVIAGLRGSARQRVIDALAGLPSGRPGDLSGEIEVHGVRMDLSAESLAMLDLDAAIDNVVRADQLPGADPGVGRTSARRRALEVEREEAEQRLAEARAALGSAEADRAAAAAELEEASAAAGSQADLDARRRSARAEALERVAAATTALEVADAELASAQQAHADMVARARPVDERALDQAGARHAAARAAVEAATAAIEEAGGRVDGGAGDRVHTARAALAAADARLESARSTLEAARARVDTAAPAPGAGASGAGADVDAAEVAAALAAVEGTPAAGAPVSAALTLADQWDHVTSRLATIDDETAADPDTPRDVHLDESTFEDEVEDPAVSAARLRVIQARRAVEEAEVASGANPVAPADVEALEAAHAESLAAQEKSEGRFGGGKAKRKMEAAKEREQELLDRLGFTTYAEFMMSSARNLSPADEDALEVAQANLQKAESVMRVVTDRDARAERSSTPVARPIAPGRRPALDARAAERTFLRTEQERLRAEAFHILGGEPGEDVAAELRALEGGGDMVAAFDRLRAALAAAGLAVDDAGFQRDTLVALAQVWLDEHAAAAADGSDPSLGMGDEAVPTAEATDVDGPIHEDVDIDALEREVVAAGEALASAGAALLEAEAESAAADEAASALSELETALEAARAEEAEAEAALREAEAARDAAASEAADPAEVEAAAAAVEAAVVARAFALTEEAAAATILGELGQEVDEGQAGEEQVDPRPALESRLADLTAAVGAAGAEVTTLELEVSGIGRRIAEAEAAEAAEADPAPRPAADRDDLLEEIEWYLLSRVAAQRQESLAGSVPLVLDDPFSALGGDESARVIEGIERMAGAVQMVIVTDEDGLARWAEGLGPERAMVVSAA